MESIINKLTEIESAASAIAEHAELQKSVLDKEYEEKRKQFDLDLEQETQAHLQKIREALEADTQTLLDQQAESNDSCVLALKKEYESRHRLSLSQEGINLAFTLGCRIFQSILIKTKLTAKTGGLHAITKAITA